MQPTVEREQKLDLEKASYPLRMEVRQAKLAIFVVWIILSWISLGTLLIPFLFSEKSIATIVPRCEWQVKYNKECPLCGMTRGFILFPRGNFARASEVNKCSPYLYSAFALNNAILTFVLLRKLKERLLFRKASFPREKIW